MDNQICEIMVSYKPFIPSNEQPLIQSAEDAFRAVLRYFDDDTIHLQEQFIVLYLNRANRVIGGYKISVGGITGTVADIRLILSVALKSAATGMILSHNHPSGSLKPSYQDEQLTQKIKQAAEWMDIKVIDHLILNGQGGFFSFAEEGLL